MPLKVTSTSRVDDLERVIKTADFKDKEEREFAFELIEAIREDVEEMQDEISNLKDEISNAATENHDLETECRELKEELDFQDSFNGYDTIHWEANNLMDKQVMESVQEAFGKYTHTQILEKLK